MYRGWSRIGTFLSEYLHPANRILEAAGGKVEYLEIDDYPTERPIKIPPVLGKKLSELDE